MDYERGFEEETLDEINEDIDIKKSKLTELFDWFDTIVIALISVVIIFSLFFRLATIVGPSMQNTLYSGEQAVEEGTVFEKEMPEFFVDGKNTVSVCAADQFKRHGSSPVEGIFSTTGRTESGVTAERDKFERTTVRASIHGTTIGRIPAINHPFDVFHDNRTWMECVLNFFIIVSKNFL